MQNKWQRSAKNFVLFVIYLSLLIPIESCKKDREPPLTDTSDNLALDSLVSTKKNIATWEAIYITAYARGQNLSFQWSANHGSMTGRDSVTVMYWACESCVGLNTVECKVNNEYGTVSDTIMIRVNP